jgi:hypothetical protein
MDSPSRRVVTVLKRLVGALMALIGGLLIVGIGVFILGLLTVSQNPSIGPSESAFDSFFVLPLEQAFVLIYFAFFAAAPVWLLFYVPCHLLIPRNSVLWQPWLCVPLGAVAGAAAFWAELSIVTWGHDFKTRRCGSSLLRIESSAKRRT